jgi:hypothetical protein
VQQAADEIVGNAPAYSPEMTCGEMQNDIQSIVGSNPDKSRRRAIIRELKRALRARGLDRHEIMRGCLGCIKRQYRLGTNQTCGVDPGPTTTNPGGTTTTIGGGTTTTIGGPTTTIGGGGGACPNSIELRLIAGARNPCTTNGDCDVGTCNTTIGRCQTPTELDTGWTGISHDSDITDDATILAKLNCPAGPPNCGVCNVQGLKADPGNCRCANNSRTICDQPFAADADDCGGAQCLCYLGPPLSLSAGNTPVCIINRFAQNVSGTTNVQTGAGATLVKLRSQVYLGEALNAPCPYCNGDTTPRDGQRNGTCVLGPNAGQSCDADGFNYTFPAPGGGAHSIDCFPAAGKNVSGQGLQINLDQTTGARSLGSNVVCGLPPSQTLMCHCGLCSGNQAIPCSSNTECSAVGAGTCERKAAFDPSPNQCNGACTDAGGGEGACDAAGPDDTGCDGMLRANGEFFIACTSNADCDPNNIGIDGGNCTLSKRRECFLPTITAQGTADPEFPVGVATFCIPPTSNLGINSTAGLPGPGRVISQGQSTAFCGAELYSPITGCPSTATTTIGGGTTTTVPPPTTTTIGGGTTTTTTGVTTTTLLSNACGNTFPTCGGDCPDGTVCTNTGSVCHCDSTGGCAPATVYRRILTQLGDYPVVRATQLSTGWSGTAHDIDIPGDGMSADVVDVQCNANCENCSVHLNPIKDDPQAFCRCEATPTTACDTINGPDADDCGTGLNNRCQCYFGAPLAISAGGTPVCAINRIKSDYGGTVNLRTGEWFDTVSLVSLVHLGISTTAPCPTCEGDVTPNDGVRNGTCNGGLSSGACDVNGTHATFGPVSWDCPPNSTLNVSGNGLQINLKFTTATASLAATLPCSNPYQAFDCPCKVCAGDGTLGCSSDAECQAAGAGTCTATGGAGARPNQCADTICGNDADCDAGPIDKYCDGITHADGRGFDTCTTDAECATGGGGTCSISEKRRCYPDPIIRRGDSGPSENTKVAVFCIPPTTSAAINNSGGLPGPGTFDISGVSDIRCRNDRSLIYPMRVGANGARAATTTTSTTLPLPTCENATAPLCVGTCSTLGQTCGEISAGVCGCLSPAPPCGGTFPACSGSCAQGQLCLPDLTSQSCLCTVPPVGLP